MRRLRSYLKELFQEGIAGSGTASPLPVKRKGWMRSAPGSTEHGGVVGWGSSEVSPLCLVPPCSAITGRVSPTLAGAEGTALGTESPGQGELGEGDGFLWSECWRGRLVAAPTGMGTAGTATSQVFPKGVKPQVLAVRWDADTCKVSPSSHLCNSND